MNIITAKYLAVAHLFAGKDDSRRQINGVFLTPHPSGTGALIVATNGCTMVVIRDEGGTVEDEGIYPLNRATVAWCTKRGNANVLVEFRGGHIAEMRGAQQPCIPIDATYVDWRAIIPNTHGTPRAFTVDAEYLALFVKASKIHGRQIRGISFGQFVENGAVVVKIRDWPEFYGLVMPIRADIDMTAPGWWAL